MRGYFDNGMIVKFKGKEYIVTNIQDVSLDGETISQDVEAVWLQKKGLEKSGIMVKTTSDKIQEV